MNHYICLEELDAIIERNTLWKPAFWELTKNMEAITKADICREFAEKVTDIIMYDVDVNGKATTNGIKINKAIEQVLAEMEGE